MRPDDHVRLSSNALRIGPPRDPSAFCRRHLPSSRRPGLRRAAVLSFLRPTHNGSGVYTAQLIQYKITPSGKTYYTDHTVEVTLGQEYNETDVTMDATKSIDLYPV